MARPLRIEYPGAVYHVTSRGNRRCDIFCDDDDRGAFLKILCETLRQFDIHCYCFCLMGNHYHLALETAEANLSRAMRQLNGVYTQSYNRKHNKCGHVFQGRYKAVLVSKTSHLQEVCRYIVLNPVRAKLVREPWEWAWSSYRSTAGMDEAPGFLSTEWVLEKFGGGEADARRRYIEFVYDGMKRGLWEGLRSDLVLGDQAFARECVKHGNMNGDRDEIPRGQRCVDRPALNEVLSGNQGKGAKWLKAVEDYGYTQKEVARQTGVHYSYVSRVLKRERSKVKT